jgi:hypothetical protein
MSATVAGQTGSRTVARRALTGAPSAHEIHDAAFLALLVGVATWGFRTTFDSPRFLAVAMVGTAIGVAVAHVATTLRQSWPVLLLLAVVAFFLFGGAVALSGDTLAGIIPTRQSLWALTAVTVSGWKGLLTTMPPVDGGGQFLVLPYLLGLAAGTVGFAWARRSPLPAAPVLAPTALLATVILLGTMEPAALLVQGLGFTAAAFGWVVARRRRLLRVVGTGSARRSQGALAAALLAAAMGAAAVAGGHVPGAGARQRTVLRSYVQPPFDITRYPSPLVGFRKYTQGAKLVWDQELLTVSGVTPGERLRIAVLDDYSGTVWSAGNAAAGAGGSTFRKVGSRIAAVGVPAAGTTQTVRITVDPAYAGLADANLWVPGVGYPSRVTFAGPRSATLADSLRYNTGTGQAVVAARLAAGDVITSTQVRVSDVPKDFQPFGSLTLDPSTYDFVTAKATNWAAKKPTPWEQLRSVGETMRASGAYSDGSGAGEGQYLPGHGLGRLTSFLAQPQLVGTDEQYAATFALMANDLGIPARVVFGAVVAAEGHVRGQDMHAWVEIRGSTGDWYAVPYAAFMPDRDKHPTRQPPQLEPDSKASNVPPPNAIRPPGSLDTTTGTDPGTRIKPTTHPAASRLPAWLVTALQIVGYPVGALTAVLLALALARAARRRGRRGHGPAHRRLAQGWRDYLDHARDLGHAIPAGLTRQEQAGIVGRADLAAAADRAVFGPADPQDSEIRAYWEAVGAARRALTKASPRGRRWLRWFSIRGLLTRDSRPVEDSAAVAGRRRVERHRFISQGERA